MSYDVSGRQVLDYEICAYDGSRLKFRGPKHDLSDPYVAFLGTTETFGKFIADPFPELVSSYLPAGAVNLGMVNGGVDAYLNDPAVLDVAKQADLRVVQVMGALNLSNHYFSVHPRRNDRLVTPHDSLRQLFPKVDFAEFTFTKAMLLALKDDGPDRYEMVCKELQDIWLARMTMLLSLLGERTVLLWFADHAPPEDAVHDPQDPILIDRDLVDRMRRKTSAYVEVVPKEEAKAAGTQGMIFGPREAKAAHQMLGPIAHQEAAKALQSTCARILG